MWKLQIQKQTMVAVKECCFNIENDWKADNRNITIKITITVARCTAAEAVHWVIT